ncbi:sugar-binding transcriptional regulator [Neisseria leonii]|uniref:Sugar-binding transcriptional regulator n=1 Tax=Neisseria leonii TaxID=2995413 RepID=A0A9X4E2P5_9NEIS|nr:sugar-binding transcriptional regulator [Neisseria sp. 51.81]MDD9328109.1 sugar-binding transcriptional regulator [Neisseria sp. 51.81]
MDTPDSTLPARDIQAIEAAKLYYQAGKSQQETADLMDLSRPTVSKLLQYAAEQGYVEIRIHDPRDDQTRLAEQLKQRYKLSEVRIVPTPPDNNYAALLHALGEAGARLLENLIGDGDTVAVEWSNSIQAAAQALRPQNRHNVKIVQLRGSDTGIRQGLNEAESISLICRAFQATGETLPLPAVFDSLSTKNLVEQESHIRRILEYARHSRIAVFTVGAPDRDSLLLRSGFFHAAEIDCLTRQAAGSICARFVDAQGRICLPDLNNRTIGLTLPELRRKEQRVLIAGGQGKAQAVRVALVYGYANRLITDDATARFLLTAEAA